MKNSTFFVNKFDLFSDSELGNVFESLKCRIIAGDDTGRAMVVLTLLKISIFFTEFALQILFGFLGELVVSV